MDSSDDTLDSEKSLAVYRRLIDIPQSDESLAWLVDSLPDSVEKEACKVLLEVQEYSIKVADDEEAFANWFGSIREGLSGRNNADRLVGHLTEVTNEYDVPHQFVFDFVKGARRHYVLLEFPDFAELETCAYLSSSALLLCIAKVNGLKLETEEELEAMCKFGVGDFLLNKLANIVPQLQAKRIFIPAPDWVDRRLDLYNQTEPFEDELWKNLMQFQCARIQEHLDRIESVCSHNKTQFGKALSEWAIRNTALVKKIHRNPQDNLRQAITLSQWDNAKVWLRRFFGFKAERQTSNSLGN